MCILGVGGGGCGHFSVGAEYAGSLSVAVALGAELSAVTRLAVERSSVLGHRRALQHLVTSLYRYTHTHTRVTDVH